MNDPHHWRDRRGQADSATVVQKHGPVHWLGSHSVSRGAHRYTVGVSLSLGVHRVSVSKFVATFSFRLFASYGPTLRVAAPDAHVPQAPSSRWLTAIRAQHAQAPPPQS